MKKILCIGDSNTFGYDPERGRYPADVRWTALLGKEGYNVINNGQNGRTIPAAADPSLRRRRDLFAVTVMLGTNDLLGGCTAAEAGERLERYLGGLSGLPVLVISPPVLQYGDWVGSAYVIEESRRLAGIYAKIAERYGFRFADSAAWHLSVTKDGVHLTADGHREFARQTAGILAGM